MTACTECKVPNNYYEVSAGVYDCYKHCPPGYFPKTGGTPDPLCTSCSDLVDGI